MSLKTKGSKIKIVLTDVDGVLTDGGMYYTEKGDIMKKFHARDGMGVTLLRRIGIPTIIVTKEKNKIIKQWATKMKVSKVYDGIMRKEEILSIICKKFDVIPQQVAYIGDDVNDIELLKKVGFSITPNDATKEAKKNCDYICKNNGGNAVFREVVDLIYLTQKHKIEY